MIIECEWPCLGRFYSICLAIYIYLYSPIFYLFFLLFDAFFFNVPIFLEYAIETQLSLHMYTCKTEKNSDMFFDSCNATKGYQLPQLATCAVEA